METVLSQTSQKVTQEKCKGSVNSKSKIKRFTGFSAEKTKEEPKKIPLRRPTPIQNRKETSSPTVLKTSPKDSLHKKCPVVEHKKLKSPNSTEKCSTSVKKQNVKNSKDVDMSSTAKHYLKSPIRGKSSPLKKKTDVNHMKDLNIPSIVKQKELKSPVSRIKSPSSGNKTDTKKSIDVDISSTLEHNELKPNFSSSSGKKTDTKKSKDVNISSTLEHNELKPNFSSSSGNKTDTKKSIDVDIFSAERLNKLKSPNRKKSSPSGNKTYMNNSKDLDIISAVENIELKSLDRRKKSSPTGSKRDIKNSKDVDIPSTQSSHLNTYSCPQIDTHSHLGEHLKKLESTCDKVISKKKASGHSLKRKTKDLEENSGNVKKKKHSKSITLSSKGKESNSPSSICQQLQSKSFSSPHQKRKSVPEDTDNIKENELNTVFKQDPKLTDHLTSKKEANNSLISNSRLTKHSEHTLNKRSTSPMQESECKTFKKYSSEEVKRLETLFSNCGLSLRDVCQKLDVEKLQTALQAAGPDGTIVLIRPHKCANGKTVGPALQVLKSRTKLLISKDKANAAKYGLKVCTVKLKKS